MEQVPPESQQAVRIDMRFHITWDENAAGHLLMHQRNEIRDTTILQ